MATPQRLQGSLSPQRYTGLPPRLDDNSAAKTHGAFKAVCDIKQGRSFG